MIIKITEDNIFEAAVIHSVSLQYSNRVFYSTEFIPKHDDIEFQADCLLSKIKNGTDLYMLIVLDKAVGIVSVTNNLIDDLYVLPEEQNKGYGSILLKHALSCIEGDAFLWTLENNNDAKKLYQQEGFKTTGKINHLGNLNEIEYVKQIV